MFRIGLLEAAATCAVVVLAIIIPVVLARSHARLDKRLKNIENQREKKK
jgi:hypothetical protein